MFMDTWNEKKNSSVKLVTCKLLHPYLVLLINVKFKAQKFYFLACCIS